MVTTPPAPGRSRPVRERRRPITPRLAGGALSVAALVSSLRSGGADVEAPASARRPAPPGVGDGPAKDHGRAFALLSVLIGILAALAALTVTPEVAGDLGPGRVSVAARFPARGTTAALPPIGSVHADTHTAPLGLRASLDGLDVEEARALAAASPGDSVTALREAVEGDLPALLRRMGIVSVLWCIGAGALAGALLPGRRRWAHALRGAIAAAVTAGLLFGGALQQADVEAFAQPRFEGPIAAAPELFDTAQRLVADFDVVQDRAAVLSSRVAELYTAIGEGDVLGERADGAGEVEEGGEAEGSEVGVPAVDREVVVLHISDLHLNPVGVTLAQRVAEDFEADLVLDTGDITSWGYPLEASFADLLAGFNVPYLLVPGNHESPAVRAALAQRGLTVFGDGEVVEVAGLRIFGAGDPTFTPDDAVSSIERSSLLRNQRLRTRRLLSDAEVDLAALHQPRQVPGVAGLVPVVAVGHRHKSRLWSSDGTVVAEGGSAGADGVRDFIREESRPFEMELLRFVDRELVAVDKVSFQGTAGDFVVQRHLVDLDRIPEGDPGLEE